MMDINLLAVLLSGISNMVIGFVWYGPLFSKPWMKESKLTEKDIGSGPGVGYLFTFIAALVSAAVTSLLVHRLGTTSLLDGAFLGLLLGIGYVATTFATNYIFGQKSMKLYLIDTGYQLLAIVVAAMIATAIR